MKFKDENDFYSLDCDKAIWATDKINSYYKKYILRDVDWVIETVENLLLIEYKNGCVPGTVTVFNPNKDKKFNDVIKKYYDSLHYLTLIGKNKPKKYIYIVEYPNGDSVSRKALRNRMKNNLPFNLQDELNATIKLIESVDVYSIGEWNDNYKEFPLIPKEDVT